jgi:hypothetical protein
MTLKVIQNAAAQKCRAGDLIPQMLTAMGHAGREAIIDALNSHYGEPIHDSGELIDSIAFTINTSDNSVTWGSSAIYAPFVHEGVSNLSKRPFLVDGIVGNMGGLEEAAVQAIRNGA